VNDAVFTVQLRGNVNHTSYSANIADHEQVLNAFREAALGRITDRW
jgi:hypothetical protein